MSDIQYVGARYVPKFAEPLAWNKNKTYEPLTIVQYLNESFTSKIPVPAGTEITDEKYWARTGAYNAQVEQYRQETEKVSQENQAIKEDLANYETEVGDLSPIVHRLNNLNIVCVSDSLGNPDREGSWCKELQTILGLPKERFVYEARDGYGFIVENKKFIDLLRAAYARVLDASQVTHVLCDGDYNDSTTGWNGVSADYRAFWKEAKRLFPNAKLVQLNLGWSNNPSRNLNLFEIYNYMALAKQNVTALNLYQFLWSKYNIISGDHLHYNINGANVVAVCIASFINTGKSYFSYQLDAQFLGGTSKLKCILSQSGIDVFAITSGTITFTEPFKQSTYVSNDIGNRLLINEIEYHHQTRSAVGVRFQDGAYHTGFLSYSKTYPFLSVPITGTVTGIAPGDIHIPAYSALTH